ncbi:hypothetical protein [Streptomyces sp. NPDC014734]|uniref:hypothetical protein n=1 Tax=Streptomyces sp. NPDC014734 TaxID=3364886 RepID=UPI0036F613AA
MKLRAKPYLHCAPLPDGVYFSGARTEFTIRGWDQLFKIADVCVPMLEDGASEDALVSALGSERARPVVRRIVQGLREHGMLLEPERWTAPEPSADVRERYAGPLAHLESVSADPYAAFARVRAATVVVFGPEQVVRPATRGLTRAGVGRVIAPGTASWDPSVVAGADAVIWCAAPGEGDERTRLLPDPRPGGPTDVAPVVPVWLDDRLLLAGPVLGSAVPGADVYGPETFIGLRNRALAWADAEGVSAAARPVADALAGALAAQLVFETLTGSTDSGAVHVVHGAELRSDRIAVEASGPADGAGSSLPGPADGVPAPGPEEAVELARTLTQEWTGLFRRSADEDALPQMPLALRELTCVARNTGTVTVWAADQQAATLAVSLEALRRSCTGEGTAAAGLSEEQWLLDGALRLLADEAAESDVAAGEIMAAETLRLRKILRELRPDADSVRLFHVPGVDWHLGTVEAASTGEVLGRAWAADADGAVRDAISTALARAQVAAFDSDRTVPVMCTNALMLADATALATLRAQLGAAADIRGITYRGRPQRVDPVFGHVPFWHGPIQARPAQTRPLAQEATDAR